MLLEPVGARSFAKSKKITSRLAVFSLIIYTSQVAAWGGAIWPFNTPYMVAKQICRNSEDWAQSAALNRAHSEREQLLGELRRIRALEIRSNPEYRLWIDIYYSEMARSVKLVWRNPNLRSEMAVDVVKEECSFRRKQIQKMLEDSDPR